MNLLHNDIIVRNYKDGQTIWVSQRLVMQMCQVSEEYFWLCRSKFKKSIQKGYKYGDFLPNTGSAWRWGKANGTFYYDYDCLPDRKPTHYRSKFGTRHELLAAHEALLSTDKNHKQNQITSLIQSQVNSFIDNTATRYFMYDAVVGFNQKTAEQMATGRAWCLFLIRQLDNDNFKGLGITKKQDFLQVCTDMIAPLQLEGFKVNSAAYLRNKINEFPFKADLKQQLDFFVSAKYGNNNARIVGKTKYVDESTGQEYDYDLHQALIYHLYMNPGNSTKEYLHTLWERDYIDGIKTFGLEPVAYRTFCAHIGSYEKVINTSKARHGMDWYKKNVQTYVTNEKLKYSHSLFCGDGSGTIQYQYPYYNNSKKKTEIRSMKLFVLFISDVASRAIVGWSVAPMGSHKETFTMVQDAVKMAVQTCDYQTMFEFISDNGPAFSSGESNAYLNLVFDKVRRITPGNSQANPSELQFKLFKSTLKDQANFLSSSWQSAINGQANPDTLDVKELPTYENAIIQLHELVKRWNTTPLADEITPKERFANKNPKCQPMEARVLRKLYGNHTKVNVAYMRGFVRVSKTQGYNNKEEYIFEIPQHGGIGTELLAQSTGYHPNVEVKVVWDEDMADLYTLDDEFIMSCPPSLKAHQSHAEKTDESEHALNHHYARKQEQLAYVDKMEEQVGEIMENFRDDLPYSQSMALGGNKYSYNEERLNNENTNLKKTTKKRVDRDFNNSDWSA